jgi:hypothetical protein
MWNEQNSMEPDAVRIRQKSVWDEFDPRNQPLRSFSFARGVDISASNLNDSDWHSRLGEGVLAPKSERNGPLCRSISMATNPNHLLADDGAQAQGLGEELAGNGPLPR